MPTLISGNKFANGVYRAFVIEIVKEEQDGKTVKAARVYIPALHKDQMPFELSEDGTISGLVFTTEEAIETSTSDVTGTTETNDTEADAVETGTVEPTETAEISETEDPPPPENDEQEAAEVEQEAIQNGLQMQLLDYPLAQFCSWAVCPDLKMGDPIWVIFENADLEFPIAVGSLGAVLQELSSMSFGGTASGGMYVNDATNGAYVDSTSGTAIQQINGQTFYNGMIRPMTGKDAGYEADEGLDIAGPIGTPVYSPCDGTFVYSEYGHTPWGRTKWGSKKDDTPYSIGITMDKPFTYDGKTISYIFLTHLSKLVYNIPQGQGGQKVKAGELIAYSGTANDSPHLHIGLSPSNWNPLRNNQVRAVFNSTYGQQWEAGK